MLTMKAVLRGVRGTARVAIKSYIGRRERKAFEAGVQAVRPDLTHSQMLPLYIRWTLGRRARRAAKGTA